MSNSNIPKATKSRHSVKTDKWHVLNRPGVYIGSVVQATYDEYILKNNPDLIFVIDRTKAIGGDTSQNSLVENELVQQTTAGENDQVVSLDPQVWYLAGSGIESLKLMIEDVNQAFK